MVQLNDQLQSEKCHNCGALMREYWHVLTPGIVSALVKLLNAVRVYGRNKVHIHDEMKACPNPSIRLSDHEWNNFTRLRFHALAMKVEGEGKGYWGITHRGAEFLKGHIAVPVKVKTYRNKVVDHSGEVVTFDLFRGQIPSFEQQFDFDIHKGIVVPQLSTPARLF